MKKRQGFVKALGIDTCGKSIQLEIPDMAWPKVNSVNLTHKIIIHPTSRPHTAISIFATHRSTNNNITKLTQAHSEKVLAEDNSHKDLINIHKAMLKRSSNFSSKCNKDSCSLNQSYELEVKKKIRPSGFFNLKATSQKKLVSFKKKNLQTIKHVKPNKDINKIIGINQNKDINSPHLLSNLKHAPNIPNITKKRYYKIFRSKSKPKVSSKITSPLLVSCIGKIQIN